MIRHAAALVTFYFSVVDKTLHYSTVHRVLACYLSESGATHAQNLNSN